MAVDFATKNLLGQMKERGGKPIHEGTPAEARALVAAMAATAGPGPVMRRVENHTIASSDGGPVPLRVLVPSQPSQGVIVYLHGGGWVLGRIDEYDTMARKLAERTACTVVLVDYRLAPEYPYPKAVDDCWFALRWSAAQLPNLADFEGAPLIIAGDSAGGNLAAVVARRARDRGGPQIALQVLIYPVTDADLSSPSYLDPENQLALTRESMAWFWDHYVPDKAQRLDADASPLRAASFEGLPPAVVLTAEHDVLRDEGEAYADRLKDAGVAVDLKRHAGQMHGFFTFLMLPGSERGTQQVVKAVRACIARQGKANQAKGTTP